MPLRLDIKRQFSARSDRVKSVDLHPTEPWMLASLYNGNCHIWNFENQSMIKSFEFSDLPVRTAKFIARKHWIIAGCDDMAIGVFNYNTMDKVTSFEAHSDYIRSLAVHPTQPYVISSSDDMSIKLWDWDANWACKQVFEGHSHYVMMVLFNPKDTNTFASASLDRTIKVWQLGSSVPNFTLEGHHKGVNCLDYFQGGEKPYLVSGGDDRLVKVWDYQNKTCVQTLDGHTQNLSSTIFHPELPIILTGSEDGTVRVWHGNTYRLENTLNYGLERIWTMAYIRGSNNVALGYDEGSIVVKLGREEPALSMDSSGKIIWAKHNEIVQANVKTLGDDLELKDGELVPLPIKELGSCEIYPQTLLHNPNGRFVVVCGDGEYIIYTALAWRNKAFGSALEFVWASDSSDYATRESSSKVKVFGKNFKEKRSLKPDFSAEGIFGGALLGIRSSSSLAFYDWGEAGSMIRRIEICARHVFWSDSGDRCVIAGEESFFVLTYDRDAVSAALASGSSLPEDGIEDAFDVAAEVSESVRTGIWVGDCFIFTNSVNRLNYFVGGEIVTISHLDQPMYVLGYIAADNRIYLADKDMNVVSFSLLVSVLEYQTAVMRRDFNTADEILPDIPPKHRNRVAHFLEKQGFKEQALVVSCDIEHKFDLTLALGRMDIAYEIAKEANHDVKWRQLADMALTRCKFGLADDCLTAAGDFAGQLLLYTSLGNVPSVEILASKAMIAGHSNVAFVCNFLLGKLDMCIELLIAGGRLPEAAFFARTYLPSRVSDVVALWKEDLETVNKKSADALADPTEYENLFPDLAWALKAEAVFGVRKNHVAASQYPQLKEGFSRDLIEAIKSLGDVNLEPAAEINEAKPAPLDLSSEPAIAASKPPEPTATVEPTSTVDDVEDDFNLDAELAGLSGDEFGAGDDDMLGDDEDLLS